MKPLFKSLFVMLMLMGIALHSSEPTPDMYDRKASHPDSPGQESISRLESEVALRVMRKAKFDWGNYVEIESGENSFLGGSTHLSRVCYVDGVWLLMQREIS